jgi:hypothetical protein
MWLIGKILNNQDQTLHVFELNCHSNNKSHNHRFTIRIALVISAKMSLRAKENSG